MKDMAPLFRQKACDEIVEVLLERGHVVDAIRSD